MTTVWLFSADGKLLGEVRFERVPEKLVLWRGGVYQCNYWGQDHWDYYRVPVTEIGEAEKV